MREQDKTPVQHGELVTVAVNGIINTNLTTSDYSRSREFYVTTNHVPGKNG